MTNLQIDKLSALLENNYSFFHTDLIFRALTDENISKECFEQGIKEIHASEHDGEDEFTPNEWENV